MNRRALLLLPSLLLLAAPGSPHDIVTRVGSVTFAVDASQSFPGGLLVVRLQSRRAIGTAYAILDGRRFVFYPSRRGPRALVPIPVDAVPGDDTLGVEILARRGRQRIPLSVTIAPRKYPARTVVIPEAKRPLLAREDVTRDQRQLLGLLRTVTATAVGGPPLLPPITIVPGTGFGEDRTYLGGSPVETLLDGTFGEFHRGLDYEVPPGTVVMAPAAGTVLLAGPLALAGQTLVLDHGQGLISALLHLARIDVSVGDQVPARATVGLSGDTGIAPRPHLEWRVYLHGTAVDPRVLDHDPD